MLNWLINLKFQFGFIESGNNYTESLIDFYNLICVLLVLITFLIGYWMIFILNNHIFKKNILLNIFNFKFILKGKKNLRFFINTKLEDRSFSYLSLDDIKDYPKLEGSWCILPLGFVSTVSYPSIGLEYGISPDITPLVTLKVIAHQWYWIFELEAKASPGLIEGNDNFFFFNSDIYKLFTETYGDVDAFYNGLENLDFQVLSKTIEVNLKNEEEQGFFRLFTETYGDVDAFYNGLENLDFQVLSKTIEVNLKNEEEPGFFRLLTVDNKIVLPINTPIKLIVTSVDVLHSFAIPAWGVKIDAIPGRLSEQIILIERPGTYWGQCSELCGPYHGFMPVVIEISSYPVFLKNFFN